MVSIPKKDIEGDAAANFGRAIDDLKKSGEQLERTMGLVIIVLFVGFFLLAAALATILVDVYRSKEESYTELVKTVDQQNAQIENITKGLQKYKIIP